MQVLYLLEIRKFKNIFEIQLQARTKRYEKFESHFFNYYKSKKGSKVSKSTKNIRTKGRDKI